MSAPTLSPPNPVIPYSEITQLERLCMCLALSAPKLNYCCVAILGLKAVNGWASTGTLMFTSILISDSYSRVFLLPFLPPVVDSVFQEIQEYGEPTATLSPPKQSKLVSITAWSAEPIYRMLFMLCISLTTAASPSC